MKLIHQGGLHNHGNNGYLHNHNNSIILIFIFLIRIDTVQKPGNALITQFSDIIERIKSQPSAQRSTQNRNVGYSYF